MSTHPPFSPSQLKRIQLCPASGAATKDLPDKSSSFAMEGTMLHEVTEQKVDARTTTFGPEHDALTDEQKIAVGDCLEYLMELEEHLTLKYSEQPRIYTEQKVSMASLGVKEVYGTADVIVTCGNEIHSIDWKFGQGVLVVAEDNLQLEAYGIGAFQKYFKDLPNPEDVAVVTHVVQPRLNSFTKAYYTYDEIMQKAREIKAIVNHALSTNPPFTPGQEQCRWCKKKLDCAARQKMAEGQAGEAFAAFTKQAGGLEVSIEEKAQLMTRCQFLLVYLADIKDEVVACLLDGGEVPGYKMVAGRKSRAWTDPKAAEAFLREAGHGDDKIFERKLLTAPKAEKLDRSFKKDEAFQVLYESRPGEPTLVPEADRRPAYQPPGAKEAFACVIEK